jgi:hypothetical protein
MNYSPTIISIIENIILMLPALLVVAYVTVAERKTMASMQRRLGPNAVGYYGLLQAFADALKLILKEYVAPTQANLILFFLGPIVTLIFALLGYAVIPYGPGLSLGDMELGILYMLAVSGLATYGILLAGFPNHFFTYLHLHTKNTKNTQYRMSKYPSQHFNNSGFINKTVKVSLARKCFIHTGNNQSNNSNINKEQFVLDLFRDRTAPVIPFDRDLVKGSCSDYTNKISRTTFLKN